MGAVVPFLPSIIGGVSAATGVKSASDARKGQKEQLAQSERLAAETRAQQPQAEQAAAGITSKRRARRTPGFSDAGAALGTGTTGAYLGQ